MRLLAIALLIALAFSVGRATNPPAAPARTESHIYTLRQGDVVRAPGAATRCTASVEGAFKNLFCSRSPQGRYQVVFYKDRLLVWKSGNPDKPVFSARWQP
jgi:hypothetical protein